MMRLSEYFVPTLRESPAEAEIISHKLLLRAGMIRRSSAGAYTFLPLAVRVLKKITRIVEEEMDRAGGIEVLMPILQPAEIWQETGRWDLYGEEMFRLTDRHQRDFCLGPTHEEMITAVLRNEVRSYRDLPLRIYQIQNKYRDEVRPRFGVMRAREFIMKDLYSFDIDEEGLNLSYQAMYDAYNRIFKRCGLNFRAVEADSGAIGGEVSHEFMVLAESGEATILYCPSCNYAANAEKAVAALKEEDKSLPLPIEKVSTPGRSSIQEISEFLSLPKERLIKSLLYQVGEELIIVLLRGDDELNEIKLGNFLNKPYRLPSAEFIRENYSLPVGYIGPHGLDKRIKILADLRVEKMVNSVCGANEEDYHLVNINPGRDFAVDRYLDLRLARVGDPCPRCSGSFEETRGVEVGHIFKLGDRYSSAMRATFLDENGQEKPMIMGCYGIGISRIMAAAIEQYNDKDGIKWPTPIAPFQAIIVPVTADEAPVAEEIYAELLDAGVEVLLDDRPQRPGVKFKDADLIGIPLRLTVGARSLGEGKVEAKIRMTGEELLWPISEIVGNTTRYLKESQIEIC